MGFCKGSSQSFQTEISFTCKLNSFHMNVCAPGLILIVRFEATWKFAIDTLRIRDSCVKKIETGRGT